MAKTSVKKIAKANPSVDATQVTETLVLVERLRKAGVAFPSFKLVLPFSKRISKVEDNRTTLHVRKRSTSETP